MSLLTVSILLSLTFKAALAVTQKAAQQVQTMQSLHTIDTAEANKNATQLETTASEKRDEAKKARNKATNATDEDKAQEEYTADQAEKIADQAEKDATAAREIADQKYSNSKSIQNAVNKVQQAAEKSGTVKSNGAQDFSELASKGVKEYQLGLNHDINSPRFLDQTAKDAQFTINPDGTSSVRINGQDYSYISQTPKNAGQVQYTYKGENGTVTFTKTNNSVTSSISPSTPSSSSFSSSSGSASGGGFESKSYKKTSYLGSQIINLDDYFLEGK